MKNIFKFISLASLVLLLIVMGQTRTNAQCALVSPSANGSSVSVSISCDFPVYVDTGNPLMDEANFENQKAAWSSANFPALGLWASSYYQMHQSDYDAMAPSRKAAIIAKPDIYVIVQ